MNISVLKCFGLSPGHRSGSAKVLPVSRGNLSVWGRGVAGGPVRKPGGPLAVSLKL